MITARSVSYRNKGEGVTIGVSLTDDSGSAVTITGDVSLLYRNPSGISYEKAGLVNESTAYYVGTAGVDFMDVGKYRWWMEVMGQIYGPYELEILDV